MDLIVTPNGVSARGQLFDGYIDGRRVVHRTHQPLLDACRVLLGEGIDPDYKITMRYDRYGTDCLTMKIGVGAGLTVMEASDGRQSPTFVPYRAYGSTQNIDENDSGVVE